MSEQYFSEHPSTQSARRTVDIHVRGQDIRLTTDAGVFSKAGLDFGTRLLIESVVLSPDDGSFVDLGCGYGVVALALAMAYRQSKWTMLDVNERALELARVNTTMLGERAAVRHGDGLAGFGSESFDGVVLNPPIRAGKLVVYRLFAESRSVLKSGAALWIVIHKKHGMASARIELEKLFSHVELITRKSGYHIFRCVQ